MAMTFVEQFGHPIVVQMYPLTKIMVYPVDFHQEISSGQNHEECKKNVKERSHILFVLFAYKLGVNLCRLS